MKIIYTQTRSHAKAHKHANLNGARNRDGTERIEHHRDRERNEERLAADINENKSNDNKMKLKKDHVV